MTPPQPIRRDTVRKPGSMDVKAVSEKEKDEKEEPERGLRLEPGTALIMTVTPGFAKRLREREARRKAERERKEVDEEGTDE